MIVEAYRAVIDHYPKSEIVVKRAVQKYEKYAEEMRDKLIKAYLERGAERITAERLAGQTSLAGRYE